MKPVVCPAHGVIVSVRMQGGGGEPPSKFYAAVHRIADRLTPEVRDRFIAAVESVRNSVNLSALEAAVAAGDVEAIRTALGAGQLRAALSRADSLEEVFRRGYLATGELSGGVLSNELGVDYSFNVRDPNAVIFARGQAGTLITQIDRDQLKMVREILSWAAVEGLTTTQQARLIHDVVGIRHDWARAPWNIRQEIIDGRAAAATSRRLDAATKQQIRSRIKNGTVTSEFLDEVQSKYAHALRRRRALDIARTETIRSNNAGLQRSWITADDQGFLPKTAAREWIVTPDERLRDTHAAVPFMNPEGVPLREPFETPLGAVMYPPLEPLCRCSVGLSFGAGRGGIV